MILGPGPLHLDLDPDLGPGGPGPDFGHSTVSESFFFCHSSFRNIQFLFHLTICLLQDHNLPSHCLEARSALSRTVIFLLWFRDGRSGAWGNFAHFSQVPPWLLQATPLHRPVFSFTFYHSFPWPYHFCGMVSVISCHHAPLSFHVIIYTISLWLFLFIIHFHWKHGTPSTTSRINQAVMWLMSTFQITIIHYSTFFTTKTPSLSL